MATIDASTGQIIGVPGQQAPVGQSPYTVFASNLTSMLKSAQQTGAAGNNALQGQIGGLQRGEAALGQPGPNNPLAFIYNSASPSDLASEQGQMSKIFEPGITSIQGQEQAANENLSALNTTANTALNAYTTTHQVGRYSSGVFPGTLTQYTYDSATGQYSDQYGNPLTPPTGTNPPATTPLVNGIDYTSYNGGTDPDYTQKMQNATSTLQASMPSGFDPNIAGGILQQHKSPITPQMLSSAATTYGVNPTDLMAQVGLESIYGTSSIAKNDNNPGGIKFAGQPGATLGDPAPDGGNYAKFDNLQDGLYAQAKLIAQNSPSNKLYQAPPPPASSGPAIGTNSLVASLAKQVAAGTMSYQTAYDQVSSAFPQYGATIAGTQLLPAIQAINPKFNVNQSNAQATAQLANTENAGTTSALIEKTNGTLDMLSDAFKGIGLGESLGGGIAAGTRWLSETTGLNKSGTDNYQSLLAEARAGLQAVLNNASSLGVVTGGATATDLLPDNMSSAGLQKQLVTVKKLMDNTKNALNNLANAGPGTGTVPATAPSPATPTSGVTPSGIKYTISQ